jgi:ribose 5-phosphate isomerase B
MAALTLRRAGPHAPPPGRIGDAHATPIMARGKSLAHWPRAPNASIGKADMPKPVAIGSDEAGFTLKAFLVEVLQAEGCDVRDFGCFSLDPVDYPDVAFKVARSVARGEHDRAILVCGTGIGMSIAANKVPGVRAAQAHDSYSAERARMSNDAQVLALGARVIGPELAASIVRAWLRAEFAGGGSARKLAKISEGERAPGGVPDQD